MLKAKDWPSFQSYKDRKPPWIRLHKSLLDNYDFQKMSFEAKAILPMIWLLISEDEDPRSGLLRMCYESVSFRLRIDNMVLKQAMDEIIRAGFLERVEEDQKSLFDHETTTKTTSYESVTKSLRNGYSESEAEDRVRGRDVEETRTRSLVSMGSEIAEIVGWAKDPNWFGDYSRLKVWLDNGMDFEKDILPAIKKVMVKKTGDPPRTLKYFEQAVADAHTTRTQPMPEGKHDGTSNQPKKSKSQRARESAFRGIGIDVSAGREGEG